METAINLTTDRFFFLSGKNLLPFHLPNRCQIITKSTDGRKLNAQFKKCSVHPTIKLAISRKDVNESAISLASDISWLFLGRSYL